jgi:hypothetical protein
MVSIYSRMKDEELNALHSHFTEKYGRQMLDETRPAEKRHLRVLVDRNYRHGGSKGLPLPANEEYPAKTVAGVSFPRPSVEAELRSVQECAKEVLYRQLRNLSLAMYLSMEKNNNWESMGEQRVSISFCRNILNIPNDREATQFDADRFRRILDAYDTSLGKKSGDEMARYCKEKTVSFFGKDFYWFSELREFIKLFDADYYFYSRSGSYGAEFIFGKTVWTQIDDTPVYTFLNEYIRSPGKNCLSIAGRAPSPMQIRRVALEVICFNKWQGLFRTTKAECRRYSRHPNSAIREELKRKAMAWYGITGPDDFLKYKDQWVDLMADGVIWHEFGHQISQSDMNPVRRAFYHANSQDENVSCALGELLAEWAPVRGGKKGAIARFLETAGSDIKTAASNFYMFFSDNWYVDEEEEFLALRSNTYLGLGLYFIEPDGSVNFERMAREHGHIYKFLLDIFHRIMETFFDFLLHTDLRKDGQRISYDDAEEGILKHRQEKNPDLGADKMKEDISYWEGILDYLKASEKGWKQFQALMDEQAALLEHEVLVLVTGGNIMKYENSLRRYIVDRCREIGMYNPLKPVNSKKAVQKACKKLNIPQKKTLRIHECFDSIMGGKTYEASINYDGPPDPFITVLQEMMLESGMGNILSGMFLGDRYETEEDLVSLKEYINTELEDIRDKIEDECYRQIDLLRVNKLYADPPLVRKILKTIKFSDGGSLADKIKAVESASFDNDAILEAVIPLRRGYMDWDTIQAIQRINQDLRPDEFWFQWSIYRDFLEFLFDGYAD